MLCHLHRLQSGVRAQSCTMQAVREDFDRMLPPYRVIWQSGAKFVAYRGKDYVKQDLPPPKAKGPRLSMAEQAERRAAAAQGSEADQKGYEPLDLTPHP